MPEPDDIPSFSVGEIRSRLEDLLAPTFISPRSTRLFPHSTPSTPATPHQPFLSPVLDRDERGSKRPSLLPPISKRSASCTERPPIAPKPRLKSPARPQQLTVPPIPERKASLLSEYKSYNAQNDAHTATSVRSVAAHFDSLISTGKISMPASTLLESYGDVALDNTLLSPAPVSVETGSTNGDFSDSISSDCDYSERSSTVSILTSAKHNDEAERDERKAFTFAGRRMPPAMMEELKNRKSLRVGNNSNISNNPREDIILSYNNNEVMSGTPKGTGKTRPPFLRKGKEVHSELLDVNADDNTSVNFRPNSDVKNIKRPNGISFSRESALSNASEASLLSECSRQSEPIVYNTGDPAEDTRLKKLHYAALEIYTVEKKFVQELQLIAVDYPKFLEEYGRKHGLDLLQSVNGQAHIVKQIEIQMLMIKEAHTVLLEKFTAKINKWTSHEPNMAECLKNNSGFLKFCLPYLKDKKRFADELKKQFDEDRNLFAATEEFETRSPTRISVLQRLDIVHQNVVRYAILMEAYKKYLLADSREKQDCEDAIKELAKVSESVNQQISLAEMEKRLVILYRRLEGRFNVFEANRHLLHEGEVEKQSRKEFQPRYLILFSDTLLICKNSRGPSLSSDSFQPDFYEYPILRIRVETEDHGEYETHFRILSTKKSAVFKAKSKRERDDWVKRLTDAKAEARKLRYTVSKRKKITANVSIPECSSPVISEFSRPISFALPEKEQSDNELSPSYLRVNEKYAAPWIPDPKATTCLMEGCGTKFSVLSRRHHCRNCGWLICHSCVGYAPMKQGSVYVRNKVCPECHFMIAKKWVGASDMSLFLEPRGGFRKKIQLLTTDGEGVVSGSVYIRTQKGNENKRWGRLEQHEDGVMVLNIYAAELDKVPTDRYVLMGFKVRETELEEGGRLFELSHTNQVEGNAMTFAFRVAHSGNAEKWSRAFLEGLQAFSER